MWFIHTKSWFGVVSRVACGAGERNSDISIHGRHKPMHDRVYVCWAALCNAVCTRDMCVCDRRLVSQHSTRSPPHTWTLRCCQCWLLVWLSCILPTSPVSPSRLAVSCVWSPARQRGDAAWPNLCRYFLEQPWLERNCVVWKFISPCAPSHPFGSKKVRKNLKKYLWSFSSVSSMHIGRYDNEYPGGFPDFWNSSSFCLFHLSGAYNAAVGITSGPGPGALFAFMLFAVMTSSVVIVISSRMLYSWPYGVEPCYVKQTNSLGSTIVHIESCITEISLRSNYVERKHSSVAKASANLVLFYSWYDILCRL